MSSENRQSTGALPANGAANDTGRHQADFSHAASYEEQLELVIRLETSSSGTERRITWCQADGPLGLARSPEGRIEIFIVGPELHARTVELRDNLQFQPWHRGEGGEPVLANRIVLPPASHFEQVAAFLCTELLRAGIARDVTHAFERTEPVLALALERLRMADSDFIGLCGELLLLHSLLRAAPSGWAPALVQAWKGFGHSSRDFQFGPTGVEVKATTGMASSHYVRGVHQVEPGHGVGDQPECDFFLVSIGLSWTPVERGNHPSAVSLPDLVDAILDILKAAPGGGESLRKEFLHDLSTYGSDSGLGYAHDDPASQATYGRAFTLTFARCYDMSDTAIHVLRSDDIRRRPFTDIESIRFRINLPDQVRGDVNPLHGLGRCTQHMLAKLGDGGFGPSSDCESSPPQG